MIYKSFKDRELSKLGMGNMRLPVHAEQEGRPIDYAKAQEIIDYAMANGINYFDTAYVYHNGESEKFLGEAMKKYPRESFSLATKFFIHANPDYKAVFEEQLARLQTDYIDFYLIHSLGNDTCDTYLNSGCIEYFLEKKRKARSNISASLLMQIRNTSKNLPTITIGISASCRSTILTGTTAPQRQNTILLLPAIFRSSLWNRFAAAASHP